MVMPRYAVGSSPHCSRSDTPSRPTTSIEREEVVVAEAGRVADDVGCAELAVDGDDAVGDDALDGRADQLDVRPAQRRSQEPSSCRIRLPIAG